MTAESLSQAQIGTAKLRRPHPPQVITQEQVPDIQPQVAETEPLGSTESQTTKTLRSGEKVTIDFGDGLAREESTEAIIAAYKEREQTAQMKAAAEALMAKAGAVDHVAKFYASLQGDRRRRFEEVLRDQAVLDRLGDAGKAPVEPEFFPQEAERPDPRLDAVLSKIEQHHQILMGLGQERVEATINQQVDTSMKAWGRVFEQDPDLAKWARESVMMKKALNPDTPIDKLVEGVAQQFASYVKQRNQSSVVESGPSRPYGTPRTNGIKPTREALMRGDLSRDIAKRAGFLT